MVMLLCFWGNFVIITNQDPNKEDYSRVVESFPIRYHFPCYPASSQNWTFFPTQSKTNPGWVYWTKPLWIHTVGAVGCAQSWTDDWFVKPHIHLYSSMAATNAILKFLYLSGVLRVSNVDRVDSSCWGLFLVGGFHDSKIRPSFEQPDCKMNLIQKLFNYKL